MKKKIAFLLLIMLLIMTIAVSLIGCTPSRPDKFVQRLLVSNSWGVTQYDSNGKMVSLEARNRNLRYSYGSKTERYYLVGKNIVEEFALTSGVWSYTLSEDKEGFGEKLLQSTPNDVSYKVDIDFKYITEDFMSKYENKGGKWYERNTQPACLYVKGNDLYYEKNNYQIVLSINYRFGLPQEALQTRPVDED